MIEKGLLVTERSDVPPELLEHQVSGLPERQGPHHTLFTGRLVSYAFPDSILIPPYLLLGCQRRPCPASHYFLPVSQLLQ